jgi:integrase
MPARSALVPKYCLHKPSGRAYVRIRGKVIYTGDYGTAESKQEYGRLVAELAASSGSALPASSATGITVVELADAYWQFAQGYYRKQDGTPSGWLAHIHLALHKHLAGLYGHTPAADFGPKAFKAIRQTLIDAGHTRQYINKLTPVIVRAFKWAAAEEIISAEVYHALQTVEGLKRGRSDAPDTEPVKPVADELVDATLPHTPRVVADMVRFQRLTGARPGEVCQIRPADLDRSGEVWQYRPADHKTAYRGRERCIYIGPKAQVILLPYLLRDAEANCFSPAESEDKRHEEQRKRRRTRVQSSQQHRRKAKPVRAPRTAYTKDSYQRAIARAVVKANEARKKEAEDMGIEQPILLPHWHANQLRHSKATEVRRQFGLEAAQVSLGHAKADITQVYAERDSRLAVEVALKIG